MRQALVALFSAVLLASCATPTREQSLVNRAVDAMGGAEKLAADQDHRRQGNRKHWEPEQSVAPGGEMRFANERPSRRSPTAARAERIDWVKNFAYPAPRTFKFSEIVTPEAGYVIGSEATARNAQNLKSKPPAHSMSGLRLATTQRELRRGCRRCCCSRCEQSRTGCSRAADMAATYPGGAPFGRHIHRHVRSRRPGCPARVRTLDYDNVWGDVNYDLVLSDWRDVGGVRIPTSQQVRAERPHRHRGQVHRPDVQPAGRCLEPADRRPRCAPARRSRRAGNVPYQWVLRRQFIGTYMDSDSVSYDTRALAGPAAERGRAGRQHQSRAARTTA